MKPTGKRAQRRATHRLRMTKKAPDPTLRALLEAQQWVEAWKYLIRLEKRERHTLSGGELCHKLGMTEDPATWLSWQSGIDTFIVEECNAESALLRGLREAQGRNWDKFAFIQNYLCFAPGAVVETKSNCKADVTRRTMTEYFAKCRACGVESEHEYQSPMSFGIRSVFTERDSSGCVVEQRGRPCRFECFQVPDCDNCWPSWDELSVMLYRYGIEDRDDTTCMDLFCAGWYFELACAGCGNRVDVGSFECLSLDAIGRALVPGDGRQYPPFICLGCENSPSRSQYDLDTRVDPRYIESLEALTALPAVLISLIAEYYRPISGPLQRILQVMYTYHPRIVR
jgi:hypothetical protein